MANQMHNRTLIRKKIKEVLSGAGLKIKNISYMRPNPVFLQDLPHVCVFYKREPLTLSIGSTNTVKQYERTLELSIDIITNGSPSAEDFLDIEAFKIEFALVANAKLDGLSIGIVQTDTVPYIIEGDSEVLLWGTSLKFDVPYLSDNYLDEKYPTLESFLLEINKEDYTDETVDKTLISAEKNLKL